MTTKQQIKTLKQMLTDALLLIDDISTSNTCESFKLGNGSNVSYLTALVRKHIQLGWNPFKSMKLNHNEIVDVTIKQGTMHFTLINEKGELINCYVGNITFPPKSLRSVDLQAFPKEKGKTEDNLTNQ